MKWGAEIWRGLPRWGKWCAVVAAVFAVIAVGASLEGEDKGSAPRHAAASNEPPPHRADGVSAEQMADILELREPAAIERVCMAREELGPRLALVAFSRGYHGRPHFPSTAEMFAEVSSRC